MRTRIGARAGAIVAALALGVGGFFALGNVAAASPTGFTVLHSALAATCQLAHVDLGTGALTPFGPNDAGHCTFDLAVAPGGTALYGVTFSGSFGSGAPPNAGTATAQLIRYDPTSGAATTVGTIGAFTINGPSTSQGNLTFDNAGNLFVQLVPNLATGTTPCDWQSICLYRVDPTNPSSATALGHVPVLFTTYFGLAASCGGSVLSMRTSNDPSSFSAGTTSTTTSGSTSATAPSQGQSWSTSHAQSTSPVTLTSVNTATGTTTDIGTGLGVGNVVQSLDFDASGAVFGIGAVASSSHVFTIDSSTGVATAGVATTPAGTLSGLAIGPPCPPTPAIIVTPRFTG
jgi:hypothetical protein